MVRDPVAEFQDITLYRYVFNMPCNGFDAWGLEFDNYAAFMHWFIGKGLPYGIQMSEIAPSIKLRSSDRFNKRIQEICEKHLSDKIVLPSLELDLGLPLGRVVVDLKGDVNYTESTKHWSFSGYVTSSKGYDDFDFNLTWIFDRGGALKWEQIGAETILLSLDFNLMKFLFPETRTRTRKNEASTLLGRIVGDIAGATDYRVYIFGQANVNDEGCCE